MHTGVQRTLLLLFGGVVPARPRMVASHDPREDQLVFAFSRILVANGVASWLPTQGLGTHLLYSAAGSVVGEHEGLSFSTERVAALSRTIGAYVICLRKSSARAKNWSHEYHVDGAHLGLDQPVSCPL